MKILTNINLILSLVICFNLSNAQDRTVGIFNIESGVAEGYTLFSPAANTSVYLINECGQTINTWHSEYRPGNAVYLTPDGFLYRAGRLNNLQIHAGGAGGIIEKFNWAGDRVWYYEYNSPTYRAHHDFQVLPNGNVLILAWELKNKEEALEHGRDPNLLSDDELWPEVIIEVEPQGSNGGTIVWEWHAWDHMIQNFDDTKLNYGIVGDHPKKINLNYIRTGIDGADWQHANSIDYNADLDQVMLSVLFFDEIWIIDHNTTTEEASGWQGDLLFRWGNPQTYDQGSEEDQQLFGQHNAHWIPKGLPDENQILIFNNGVNRPEGLFSTVEKLNVGLHQVYPKNNRQQFLPNEISWSFTYEEPTEFYSRFISGAHQLSNGNVFVTDGAHGTFFEINSQGEEVWRYVSPVTIFGVAEQGQIVTNPTGEGTNAVFRATKYPINYPAFTARDMTAKLPIEGGADIRFCLSRNLVDPDDLVIRLFPNPTSNYVTINNYEGPYEIYNLSGQRLLYGLVDDDKNELDLSTLNNGLYLLTFQDGTVKKLVIE